MLLAGPSWSPHNLTWIMLDLKAAGPHDPDASSAWVYLLYGATMSSIQGLEHSLAFLSLVATADPYASTNGTMRDQIPGVFNRWWRAYQKDTAGKALREIEGKIPDDLHSELQAFVKRRNWLAHRFFIEQMERDADGTDRFARGTVLKLVQVAADCSRLIKQVETQTAEIREAWPRLEEDPPPEFLAWIEDFGQLVTRRKARPEVWEGILARQAARQKAEGGDP